MSLSNFAVKFKFGGYLSDAQLKIKSKPSKGPLDDFLESQETEIEFEGMSKECNSILTKFFNPERDDVKPDGALCDPN